MELKMEKILEDVLKQAKTEKALVVIGDNDDGFMARQHGLSMEDLLGIVIMLVAKTDATCRVMGRKDGVTRDMVIKILSDSAAYESYVQELTGMIGFLQNGGPGC